MDGIKSFIDSLGLKRIVILGVTAAVLIAGLILLSARVNTADMGILFSDLEPAQAQAVTDKLRGLNVPYKLSADGTMVMAPAAKLAELRIQLAGEQLSGQIGYELLDKQSPLGTTAFLQNVNQVRAIEGELGRSIETLNSVQHARVHLVMPQRALFEAEERKPSAAITLRTRGSLSAGQVNAIRNLVAASVPDLTPERVSIVDQNGTLLAKSGDDASGSSAAIEERRSAVEAKLRAQIEAMLERIVGPGRVRAEVAAELNYDNVRQEQQVYDPDKQVVARSTTVDNTNQSNDNEPTTPVSVATQLPEAQQAPQNGTGTTSATAAKESSEQIDYANSLTRTTTVRDAGQIARLTVSVVVDGVNAVGPDGKPVYSARTAAELKQFTRLVENAIGYNSDRGDNVVVENLRFAASDALTSDAPASGLPFGLQVSDLISLGQTFVLGLLGLLGVFFILRPMLRRSKGEVVLNGPANPLLEAPEQQLALAPPARGHVGVELLDRAAEGDEDAIRAIQQARDANSGRLALEAEIDVAQIEGRIKTAAIKKVGEIINRNPMESAAIVRQWMYS